MDRRLDCAMSSGGVPALSHVDEARERQEMRLFAVMLAAVTAAVLLMALWVGLVNLSTRKSVLLVSIWMGGAMVAVKIIKIRALMDNGRLPKVDVLSVPHDP